MNCAKTLKERLQYTLRLTGSVFLTSLEVYKCVFDYTLRFRSVLGYTLTFSGVFSTIPLYLQVCSRPYLKIYRCVLNYTLRLYLEMDRSVLGYTLTFTGVFSIIAKDLQVCSRLYL